MDFTFLFWMWLLFGQFAGYDFHNCVIIFPEGEQSYAAVECGPPHTHETEEVKAPLRSTRQR